MSSGCNSTSSTPSARPQITALPLCQLLNYAAKLFQNEIALHPALLDFYELLTGDSTNRKYANLAAAVANGIAPSYLTAGAGWNFGNGVDFDLPFQFMGDGGSTEARYVGGQPGAASLADYGSPSLWQWWYPTTYTKINFNDDPRWDVVPRTDTNALPAQTYSNP